MGVGEGTKNLGKKEWGGAFEGGGVDTPMHTMAVFLIDDRTMITVRKKLFFSYPTRKKIMILDSVGLDLSTEKAGNRRRNHAYVESILNRIITKQGLKENEFRLIKKLKPVLTIFDLRRVICQRNPNI